MRPTLLNPLFIPIQSLSGIGPKMSVLLAKVAGHHLIDLMWHSPIDIIDRRHLKKISTAEPGTIATLRVTISQHFPSESSKKPYKIVAFDETGILTVIFFHAQQEWINKILPVGQEAVISGVLEHFQGQPQIVHPDHVVFPDRLSDILTVEPVYGLTAGLPQRIVHKAIKATLVKLPQPQEWIDPDLLKKEQWPSWKEALISLHHPQDSEDLDPLSPARQRLAYDELLANQVALQAVRRLHRQKGGRSLFATGLISQKIYDSLPFTLTESQKNALEEIQNDLAKPKTMLRLLQGDVGSGKTIVALLAMTIAIESGCQAALMAPTETLARQHYATLSNFAAPSGLKIAILTGRDKGKAREKLLERLKIGDIDILIGTHALFQEDVIYKDLALAIIDEQHRFGVQQRLDLAQKNKAVDLLVMTATPIPRTLTLTAYGDMDITRLMDKPQGRKAIETRVLPLSRLEEVVQGLNRVLQNHQQIYWVTPLIEESEKLDSIAAEKRFAYLQGYFGDKVGLLHGRMKASDKDKAMADFVSGVTRLLVSTTVIEVGVDVPEATVMVIEQAERFGMAQLHQLRGRVGRNDQASTCLLLYGWPLSEMARKRLHFLRNHTDGFLIAEEDLRLRGAGEVLGKKQSGLPDFKMADLSVHGGLLEIARQDARLFLHQDPRLQSTRGDAIRHLLYIFERDAVVATLQSG
jgi:ATP-dependent DNA helicase RecG